MSTRNIRALSLLLIAVTSGLAGYTVASEELPETQELDSADRIYNAWIASVPWYRELLCKLLLEDDPQVRVLASLGADSSWDENIAPLNCPAPLGEINPAAIRKEIAQAASDQPAVLARIYAADCWHDAEETGCDAPLIRQQLLDIDPENAYLHLLNIQSTRTETNKPDPFTKQEREQILAAAKATYYDVYWGAGLYDTYLASRGLMSELPACPMDDLLSNGGTNPQSAGACLDMMSVNLIAIAISAGARYSPLSDGCKAASEQNDREVVNACFQVADLMRDTGRTQVVTMLGAGLRRSLERPEYSGADRELQDPENWKRYVRGIEFECGRPRGLPFETVLPGTMPAGHFAAYLQDVQEASEATASMNAAEREFAAYPDAFIIDPARCAEIYRLDEAVQQQLADEWSKVYLQDDYDEYRTRILSDLVQALNAQDSI